MRYPETIAGGAASAVLARRPLGLAEARYALDRIGRNERPALLARLHLAPEALRCFPGWSGSAELADPRARARDIRAATGRLDRPGGHRYVRPAFRPSWAVLRVLAASPRPGGGLAGAVYTPGDRTATVQHPPLGMSSRPRRRSGAGDPAPAFRRSCRVPRVPRPGRCPASRMSHPVPVTLVTDVQRSKASSPERFPERSGRLPSSAGERGSSSRPGQ